MGNDEIYKLINSVIDFVDWECDRMPQLVSNIKREYELHKYTYWKTKKQIRWDFEANMLDGDSINDCGKAMLSAELVLEYIQDTYWIDSE